MTRSLWHDLRSAVRALVREPRFTAVASATLALGVGAVVSIFSVVNGVLLKPLPHPEPDRLVNVWSNAPGLGYDQFPLSPDIFYFYLRGNTVFERMAVFQRGRVNLTESGPPAVINSAVTTAGYFDTLGVRFVLERGYSDEEDRPGAPRVVVMSHRIWADRFGSDPAVLGRLLRIDGQPTEVVGVAPAWLDAPESPDLFLPARFNPDAPPAGTFGWNAVARLRPGVSPANAAAGLVPLVERFREEGTGSGNYRAFLTDGQYRPLVHLMQEDVVGGVREPLWILLGTVGMVLFIACANVAAGLALGLAGAFGLTRFLGGLLYETEPLDATTFAVMTAALFVVALLASYLPARKAAAVSPMEAIRN